MPSSPGSTCGRPLRAAAEAAAVCDRIAATGALEEARRQALTHVAEAKAGCAIWTCRRTGGARSTWWPTASWERYA